MKLNELIEWLESQDVAKQVAISIAHFAEVKDLSIHVWADSNIARVGTVEKYPK